jgi:hypothetical protein
MQQLEDSVADAARFWCESCKRGQPSGACPFCDRDLGADSFCETCKRQHDPSICHRCRGLAAQRDLGHFLAISPDRKELDMPQPTLVFDPLTPWLQRVYSAWESLGRDQDGRPLQTEQSAALERLGIRHPHECDLVTRLWQIRTNCNLHWRIKRLEAERAEAERERAKGR